MSQPERFTRLNAFGWRLKGTYFEVARGDRMMARVQKVNKRESHLVGGTVTYLHTDDRGQGVFTVKPNNGESVTVWEVEIQALSVYPAPRKTGA